jgi:hypothetical protein
MVAVMKSSVLKDVEANKGTAADMDDALTEDGGTGEDGSGIGDIELPRTEPAHSTTTTPGDHPSSLVVSEYTLNPLLTPGGDISHQDLQIRSSSVLARVSPSTSVRSLLIKILSGIDSPSLHAIDTALKNDGVENVGELRLYLEGRVIGIPELKNYAKKGRLDTARTLKLIEAMGDYLPETTTMGTTPASMRTSHIEAAAARDISGLETRFDNVVSALHDLTKVVKDKTGTEIPSRDPIPNDLGEIRTL